MCFEELVTRDLPWLAGTGPSAEIVVSSRIRLARNLQNRRFTHHASRAELQDIQQEVVERVMVQPSFTGGWALTLSDCSPRQRKYLLERHLVSPDLIRQHRLRSLLLSPGLDQVVMVNEEDHLRIQLFRSGFDPIAACGDSLALDNELEAVLDFAFNEDFGYLTSCPTNVGTGFRLSVLIHLPGLVLAGQIEKILNSLRQLRFTVRGLFGEGSAVRGAMFQVSNLGTLGKSEESLAADFAHHIAKVIQYENSAREKLHDKDRFGVSDMVHRSLGVLRNAYLITSQEAFDRLSHVRMGVSLGILPSLHMALLNRALVDMQTAHIQIRAGRRIEGRERSALRAQYLRELLS
ncbi:MAG: ATP--guanido phosphotransferase [bacterium]